MSNKIFIVLILICLLTMPVTVVAGFFDDGRWYMYSSLWEEFADWDSENRGSLVDNSDRLNWITSPGWTDGYDAERFYRSKWAFDLNSDFEFNVEFHYNYTGTFANDGGSIGMDLVYFKNGSHHSGMFAENRAWENGGLQTSDVFWGEIDINGVDQDYDWNRTSTDGLLSASYDSINDILRFEAFSKVGNKYTSTGVMEYINFKTDVGGIDQLRLYFGGWSTGAELSDGDAYLKNFNVVSGTIVPEPVSSILFITGGTLLAGRRYLKKRKQT